MAISLEPITVGVENQATGSMSLYDAFNAVKNNFEKLSNTASQYTNFIGSNGITATSNPYSGTVTIVNTGVIGINAGAGLISTVNNGVVTLSVSGYANGSLVAGVTSVGIKSNTLTVASSPIISAGNITVELPNIVAAGTYTAPTMTIDNQGRIRTIANTISVGTVTSVSVVSSDDGLTVSGGPITSDGTIIITNNGVTRLNAGPGIQLSGNTGEITVLATNPNPGTVSYVGVTSNTLTITGGPITSTGFINIELPESEAVTGNFSANNITANLTFNSLGDANIVGNITSGNAILGNLVTGNYFSGNGSQLTSITGANVTGQVSNASVASTVYTNAQPNITSVGTLTTLTVSGNISSGNLTSFDISAGNLVSATGGLQLLTSQPKPVYLSAPSSISPAFLYFALPSTQGNTNQFLSLNDNSGTMTWAEIASSSAPSTSTSTGRAGQIAYDSSYLYVCIGTNSWKRANLASW